ncbi:MAG TPA: IS1380 family transposase, partial [Gaiellales bacterium]|nr:IS1380 family transposase [Gaiellales bacterium]
MQLSHDPAAVDAVFDEGNLVSCAGLAPVLALAERAGLSELLAEHVSVPSPNAPAKVTALLAGMVAGADSIDDMDLLRHGAMDRLFTGVRAPSTLGTFLRAFRFGHVRQVDAVAARLLARLAARTPLLPGADRVAYVDVDDTVRETHGYAKQGAGFGYSGVSGLNALLGVVSTPTAAPVVAAARLRKGSTNSARGAARLVSDALKTAKAAGADPTAGALVIARMDSAFYGHDVIAAVRRAGAKFSVTARMSPTVTAAIAGIDEAAWTAIHYPNAFTDPDTGELVSDAEVAEVPAFTAFTSRRKNEQVTARLIVRRVKRLNPDLPSATARGKVPAGQEELFTTFDQWRYHAVFTDSPEAMLDAEATHRAHAVIEQVIADLKAGPLAHLPSGVFTANAAWLALATIAFNLLRAAGALAAARPGHDLAVATT